MIDVSTVMEWTTSMGGLAGIAALLGAWWTRKHGVKGDERAARAQEAEYRRDTLADRDGLIDQQQEDIAGLRAELHAAKQEAAEHITALRSETAALKQEVREMQRDLYLERAWNRTLIDQIYRGEPPPPRPRPTE